MIRMDSVHTGFFPVESNAFFVVAVQILIKDAGGHLETSSDQGMPVSLESAKISEESEALQFFPLRLQQVGFRIKIRSWYLLLFMVAALGCDGV